MLILIVADGPDKGRVYEWTDDRTVIVGRESKDVRLSDGKASRQHARFKCEGGRWYVRDLASRHGTRVNNILIEGKHPLNDGDRVRIGRTEFVVARMSAEQHERLSLLGEQPSRSEAWRDLPTWRRYMPRPTTFAMLAAAGFAIGCSAWIYQQTVRSHQTLSETLIASQDRVEDAALAAVELQTQAAETQLAMADRTEQILEQVNELGDESTPKLDQILAALQSQGDDLKQVGELRTALAQMDAASRARLDGILAEVESQSAQWITLAEVRDMVARQAEQTAALMPHLQALAAATQANESAMAMLQRQIELAQAQPDIDARILDQLEAIAAELKARPSVDKVVDEVRLALAKDRQAIESLLTRIESQVTGMSDAEALIAPLRQALAEQSQQTEQLIDRAFADAKPTADQLARIESLIAARSDQTAEALSNAIGQLQQSMDFSEVLAAVREVQAGVKDPDTLAKLDELSRRLETTPTTQQLAQAVAEAVTTRFDETRPLLERIALTLDAASIEAQDTRALMDQLSLALSEQEKADERLDRIYELLAASQSDSDNDALRQVLREIRSKSIAGMDELRSTIRREIQAGIAEQRLALMGTAKPVPSPVAIAKHSAPPQPTQIHTRTRNSNALAMAGAPASDKTVQITTVDDDGLTEVERAYRLAFTTGKPITLGSRIDPVTGKVTPGRTIDPADAKAAGITDWRDWYLMDDFKERMRLQRQALKYRDQNQADVVRIPKPNESSMD
ncbi:MAG: hypothetical protein Kow00105_02950 [Phycisphaeraceae bacterium]